MRLPLRAVTAALLTALAATAAHAEHQAQSFSASVAAYSEYEFRGISQTSEKPALRATVDYTHPLGFYVGAFASNSKWLKDAAEANGFSTDNRFEWDAYAGWRVHVARDLRLDAGIRHYDFPRSGDFEPKPSTDEVYVGVGFGLANLRYFRSLDDAFGVPDSKGSDYVEASVRYALPMLPRLAVEGLVGHQRYRHNGSLDYTVWKAGVTYDITSNLRVGAYGKGTDAEAAPYTVRGKDWSRDRVIAFVSYTF